MADSKISALPAASTPLAGIEVLPIVQSGATVKATVANITGAGAYAGAFTSFAYTTTLTGGTGIVNLGSGQFYKDVSGNVGIGTTTPAYGLEVFNQNIAITNRPVSGTSNPTQFLRRKVIGGDSSAVTTHGRIEAQTDYTLSGSFVTSSAINFGSSSGNAINSFISFETNGTGTLAERMRIDSTGKVGIGTTAPNASAILDVQSTTKGVRMPNMTTAQKNAITSPAAGLMVFDTTLSKLCVYSGIAWETVTSV